jgi:hypothetical protein
VVEEGGPAGSPAAAIAVLLVVILLLVFFLYGVGSLHWFNTNVNVTS